MSDQNLDDQTPRNPQPITTTPQVSALPKVLTPTPEIQPVAPSPNQSTPPDKLKLTNVSIDSLMAMQNVGVFSKSDRGVSSETPFPVKSLGNKKMGLAKGIIIVFILIVVVMVGYTIIGHVDSKTSHQNTTSSSTKTTTSSPAQNQNVNSGGGSSTDQQIQGYEKECQNPAIALSVCN